jgi:RHS repeat-associated protein
VQQPLTTDLNYIAEYLGSTNAERTLTTEHGEWINFATSPLGISTRTRSWGSTIFGIEAITRLPDGSPVSIRHDGGDTAYLTLDHLGSPTATTATSGQEDATFGYDPYGRTRAGSSPSLEVIGYAGGVADPGGFIKFGTRFYNPNTGRFTQMDPAGMENNPYAYALNNPINYIDPTGTSAWGVLGDLFDELSVVLDIADFGKVLAESDPAEQRRLAAQFALEFGVAAVCNALVAATAVLTLSASLIASVGCAVAGNIAGRAIP